MARKGENIYKRKDGRWEGRYIKGRKKNKQPSYGYIYGKKYKEVQDRLRMMKILYSNTQAEFGGFGGSFEEWTLGWMEGVVTSVKASTYAFYHTLLYRQILPALGKRKLNSITSDGIQVFIDDLAKKGLKASTIRGIAGLVNRIFANAVSKRALLANPCQSVVLPRQEKPLVQVMEKGEQAQMEKAAQAHPYGGAVLLALYTGMRIGEICALRWEDVDLENRTIHVRQTLQRISNCEDSVYKTKLIFDCPKSMYSNRKIPLTKGIMELLRKEKEQRTSEYVISCRGHFAESRVVRYHFDRLKEKLGMKQLTFHGLRHTFATRCMETGMDVTTLSRILGHSSVKITLDIYTDSTPLHKARAICKLDHIYAA